LGKHLSLYVSNMCCYILTHFLYCDAFLSRSVQWYINKPASDTSVY